MRHISEVLFHVETPEQKVDRFVVMVFRNVPRPLWERMLAKHSGSPAHVHECGECWQVAKGVWELRRHLSEHPEWTLPDPSDG